MVFKGFIAAVSAVALTVSPTIAAAQSTASAAAQVAPATEEVEGSELRGGFIIPLIAIIAILLGLCAAGVICGNDDNELPRSP